MSSGGNHVDDEDLSGLMSEGMSGQRGRERMEIIMPENQMSNSKRKKRSSTEQRMF